MAVKEGDQQGGTESVAAARRAVNRAWRFTVDGLRELTHLSAARHCLLCAGRGMQRVCASCRNDLPWNREACTQCARPLADGAGPLCGACARRTPPFEAAIAAFRYAAPVDQAVQRLKYNADFLAARWLGEALADAVRAADHPPPDLLLPVPLHSGRLRKRGYNQALELARVLSKQLKIPLQPQLVRRQRATEDQIGKTALERRRNVRKAFTVSAEVKGQRVALIDDVMTTGSTLAELARACRKAGAASVVVWTVARAG